jgi:hypothetical protein
MILLKNGLFLGVAIAVEISRGETVDFCAVATGPGLVVSDVVASAGDVVSGLGVGLNAPASFGTV